MVLLLRICVRNHRQNCFQNPLVASFKDDEESRAGVQRNDSQVSQTVPFRHSERRVSRKSVSTPRTRKLSQESGNPHFGRMMSVESDLLAFQNPEDVVDGKDDDTSSNSTVVGHNNSLDHINMNGMASKRSRVSVPSRGDLPFAHKYSVDHNTNDVSRVLIK